MLSVCSIPSLHGTEAFYLMSISWTVTYLTWLGCGICFGWGFGGGRVEVWSTVWESSRVAFDFGRGVCLRLKLYVKVSFLLGGRHGFCKWNPKSITSIVLASKDLEE